MTNVASLPVPSTEAQSGNVIDMCTNSDCASTKPLNKPQSARRARRSLGAISSDQAPPLGQHLQLSFGYGVNSRGSQTHSTSETKMKRGLTNPPPEVKNVFLVANLPFGCDSEAFGLCSGPALFRLSDSGVEAVETCHRIARRLKSLKANSAVNTSRARLQRVG